MKKTLYALMVSAALAFSPGPAAAENNGSMFYEFYLVNTTASEWNRNTTAGITEPTIVCGNSTFGNDSVFSWACAKNLAATPIVWDGKNALMWSRGGNLTVFYSGACTRRTLETHSDYCPASPCGTGHHTEYGIPINETVLVKVNDKVCGEANMTYNASEGADSQTVGSHGIMECTILPNETVANVTLEHHCKSDVHIQHETLSCGWELVCNSWQAYENCNHPLKSPPPVCLPAPCKTSEPTKDYDPMPGGLSGASPCTGCHRVPDPQSSCWDCKVTVGASGSANSTDVLQFKLSVPFNLSANGYYDINPYTTQVFVNLTAEPDIIAGFVMGDLYYDHDTFEPKHILYRKKSAEGPDTLQYSLDDLYAINESHENDTSYYDYAIRETFANKNPSTVSDAVSLNSFIAENGSYKIHFSFPNTYGSVGNISLAAYTVGDILSALDENLSCSRKSDCPLDSYCVSGRCLKIRSRANQTIVLTDVLRERTRASFELESAGSPENGENLKIIARLLSGKNPLPNRSVNLRVDEYDVVENLTTDSSGLLEYNITLSEKSPTVVLTYAGDAENKGMRQTHVINVSSLNPLFSDSKLLAAFLSTILLFVLFSRWLENKPYTLQAVWRDVKEVLR